MGKSSQTIGFIISLILICLFAVCVFLVLATGAEIYKDISGVMDTQFGAQTALGYTATKVRHFDIAESVSVGKLVETDAIILRETIDGSEYHTYLYNHDGYLCELFCEADSGLRPEDGQQIIAVDGFEFKLDGSMLHIACETNGSTITQSIYLRSGEAGEVA